jgi:hypothetical protein
LKLAPPAQARYVRVLMQKPAAPEGYILSEIEVFGKGGPVPQAKPGPSPSATVSNSPAARGAWSAIRWSKPMARRFPNPASPMKDWLVATVPGTVLSSYLNAGAIPDPNLRRQPMMISDSFFYADFWYRNEFSAPPAFSGKRHVWLNFDGINWKAEVFLNGEKLGRIEGAFMRGRFDVTGEAARRPKNALAVRILKNATPGSMKEKTFKATGKNGGALGADNPTFHASVGWDWIPTIRGREHRHLEPRLPRHATGPVTMENPFVNSTLPLPDTSRATSPSRSRSQSLRRARLRNPARPLRRPCLRSAGHARSVLRRRP